MYGDFLFIRWLTAYAQHRYIAGDTHAEFLDWWMAAMIAYPETQKKAQQELDEVVGRERLPSFNDYNNLPYIRAMVGPST